MKIDENFKKFPIKFYQNDKGVYFENPFMRGQAKDLNDAFEQIKKKDLDFSLWYFYDDVQDAKIGAFEPAYKDKQTEHGLYLGKLNLDIDVNKVLGDSSEHTVTYLSKNPDKIKDHEKFMQKIKNEKKRDAFLKKLRDGIKKVAGFLRPTYEMFYPYKSNNDLICDHCGDIIPTGSYYEEYKGKLYHLECIWDRLCNEKKTNTHEAATEYFLSLQEFLDNWPESLECKDDYESDLELYKANKRTGKIV